MSGIMRSGNKIQYSFPVEYRAIIELSLPPDFIGNAVLSTATNFLDCWSLRWGRRFTACRQGDQTVDPGREIGTMSLPWYRP